MHPQPLGQSTESRGSSAQSVVVHGSGASSLYGRAPRPPVISTGPPYVMPPGHASTPRDASPVAQMRRSFSDALREEFAAAHSHLHGAHPVAATSPARSGVTIADEETDERVQELLQHMQLQVRPPLVARRVTLPHAGCVSCSTFLSLTNPVDPVQPVLLYLSLC